jgi:hypothetical protein
MKRLVVKFKDSFVNIPVERIEDREGMIFAYDDKGLVGAFWLGALDAIYLS